VLFSTTEICTSYSKSFQHLDAPPFATSGPTFSPNRAFRSRSGSLSECELYRVSKLLLDKPLVCQIKTRLISVDASARATFSAKCGWFLRASVENTNTFAKRIEGSLMFSGFQPGMETILTQTMYTFGISNCTYFVGPMSETVCENLSDPFRIIDEKSGQCVCISGIRARTASQYL
jgi:hypothetical protein